MNGRPEMDGIDNALRLSLDEWKREFGASLWSLSIIGAVGGIVVLQWAAISLISSAVGNSVPFWVLMLAWGLVCLVLLYIGGDLAVEILRKRRRP